MLLETLKTLCALSGPSSFEEPVREYLSKRIATAGTSIQSIQVDAMGNLIVRKRGKKAAPDRILLAAHMDEVGLMIKRITKEGYLKFAAIGGIDRRVLLGKPVFVGPNRVPGVIGLKAIHLTEEKERKQIPAWDKLFLDIGAKDQKEAEKYTFPGDYAVFSDEIVEFGTENRYIKAKAIDDRIGCAVMLELLEQELPIDCTFVFTVQEEVGARGALAAAFSIRPEIALVLEGTTAADLPEIDPHRKVCSLGKGPVIPFQDGATVYDAGLFALLRTFAEEQYIPWQTKQYISGGTDAKSIQRSRAGVRVGALAAPVRYLHTPSSVAAVSDLKYMEWLAYAFLAAAAEGRI